MAARVTWTGPGPVVRPVSPACVLHKAQVSQLHIAQLTAEASRVPVVVHGLDDAADDEFACRREVLLALCPPPPEFLHTGARLALPGPRAPSPELGKVMSTGVRRPLLRETGLPTLPSPLPRHIVEALPQDPQHGANSIWKSCSQYFRPSNCKWGQQRKDKEGTVIL